MLKKSSLKLLGLSPLVISPLLIISSCSSDETKSVNIQDVANEATFAVNNLNRLSSSVKPNEIIWKQQNQYSGVKFSITRLTHNDKIGQITFDVSFDKNGETANLKSRTISGFQIDDQQVNPNLIVDEEIERLKTLNDNNQLVKNQEFSQIDLANWVQNPNSFLNALTNLSSNIFRYNVNAVHLNNNWSKSSKIKVSFILEVNFKTVIKTVNLETVISVNDQDQPIEPPAITNADQVRQKELNRLNQKWTLKQTNFSVDDIKNIKQNNNLILKELNHFIYQQYFQYQIIDLKINDENPGQNRDLSFKIKARLWKDNQKPLKEITSNEHRFKINIYEIENQNPAPLNPDRKSWDIQPLAEDQTIDFQNDQSNFNLAQILIRKNNQIQFDEFATKQFLLELIKAKKLVTITGDLPSDWSWDLYLDFADQTEKDQDPYFTIFIDYANSNNLESIQFNLTLTNFQYDESAIKVFDYANEFNKFKDNFVQNIKANVELDQKAISSGRDGVFNFANLDENNFLNFTNQNWMALVKQVNNLIRINAKDVKINYLKNEIKFKWFLAGLGAMSQYHWEDNDETTLVLKPTNQITNQSQIKFDEYPNAWQFDLNNLAKFDLNPVMIERDDLKTKLSKFSQNWTWNAREFVTFLRFTFYQAFDDRASDLAMAIVPKNGNLPFDQLKQNFSDFKIVLKAKLDFKNQQSATFIPFIQIFGVGFDLKTREYKTGDEIKMELDFESITANPDPVQDANEILPGMGQGITLGSGLGYQQAIDKSPARFDVWRALMGIYQFSLIHNGEQLGKMRNIHRFVTFNLLSLYNFQDLIWKEPIENNWVSGTFWQ